MSTPSPAERATHMPLCLWGGDIGWQCEHGWPESPTPHAPNDPVNSPQHYRWLPGDVEVIDITEHMSFPLGNVVKYVLRADHKGKPLEDLKKAAWYLDREIKRRESSE